VRADFANNPTLCLKTSTPQTNRPEKETPNMPFSLIICSATACPTEQKGAARVPKAKSIPDDASRLLLVLSESVSCFAIRYQAAGTESYYWHSDNETPVTGLVV
jgi:hypothetical protein